MSSGRMKIARAIARKLQKKQDLTPAETKIVADPGNDIGKEALRLVMVGDSKPHLHALCLACDMVKKSARLVANAEGDDWDAELARALLLLDGDAEMFLARVLGEERATAAAKKIQREMGGENDTNRTG